MKRPPAGSLVAIAALTITTLLVGGCSSAADKKTTSTPSPGATFPVTIGDVTLKAKPTHIISLSASATDMLFSIGAGSQVVEVDKYSTYFGANPPAAKPAADIDAYTASAESIAAKNPDLVVLADDSTKIKESLTKLGIPVFLAPAATTMEGTYEELSQLGQLTGNVDGATKVVDAEKTAMATQLARVPQRGTELKYYVELDQTYYSVTSKTLIGSLFTMAKMANIADASDPKSTGYPQLTPESIIKANPDMIFLADGQCCQQSAATVAKRPGWSTVNAVAKNQVVLIDDSVISQWGTRVPDLFKQIVDAELAYPAS